MSGFVEGVQERTLLLPLVMLPKVRAAYGLVGSPSGMVWRKHVIEECQPGESIFTRGADEMAAEVRLAVEATIRGEGLETDPTVSPVVSGNGFNDEND